jgi:serine/threonine protein kinase
MKIREHVDETLWDRFQECRNQGLPGIPHAELRKYMAVTAEAIDSLNNETGMIHGDIKPQNIFLLKDGVQLRESPFAVRLSGMIANLSRGYTPEYAAPEMFDGLVSRSTDQFSLAVVYQEMLTGERPYRGSNVYELIKEHISGKPNLASMPLNDQLIVGRALSKSPDERFPSCKDFINALGA